MSSELQNIPPLWTAVFHWLAYLLYVSLLPRRRTVRQCAVIAALLLAVQFPYMRLIAPLNDMAFNLGMTGFALLTFLPFPLLCRGGGYHHLYYCARAFILGGFTVSLAWQFYSYYSQRIKWLESFAAEVAFMQYANYQQSQESIDMINRKYHDLKHQIAVLRAEIGTRQKLDSLDQIERDIRAYESQNRTGNQVLDAILTGKSSYCLEHGIIFTCVADGSALDFLGVVEVSALFGNALDNAIEAVSKLTAPEQRLIHLSVTRQKGFLRIKVENRCVDDLVVGEELPKTTKEDKGLHGYGLKSIRATVEQYGGSVTLRAENGWFTLGVLIPRPMGTVSQAEE